MCYFYYPGINRDAWCEVVSLTYLTPKIYLDHMGPLGTSCRLHHKWGSDQFMLICSFNWTISTYNVPFKRICLFHMTCVYYNIFCSRFQYYPHILDCLLYSHIWLVWSFSIIINFELTMLVFSYNSPVYDCWWVKYYISSKDSFTQNSNKSAAKISSYFPWYGWEGITPWINIYWNNLLLRPLFTSMLYITWCTNPTVSFTYGFHCCTDNFYWQVL